VGILDPLKANSHIPCRSHAVPLKVYVVSSFFDLHSAAVFDSIMPYRARTFRMPYHDHTVLKASFQDHGRARQESGMATAWYV
jgi:hypothetical protein